jgi:hypothetical protein
MLTQESVQSLEEKLIENEDEEVMLTPKSVVKD